MVHGSSQATCPDGCRTLASLAGKFNTLWSTRTTHHRGLLKLVLCILRPCLVRASQEAESDV